MVYFKSAESLDPETMSQEERTQIIELRYKDYFDKSCEDLNTIAKNDLEIINITDQYNTTVRLLKDRYSELSEEAAAATVKLKFLENIKNWFAKVWSVIVVIFQKITVVIINTIKSLIIYIRRQNLLKNSLWTMLKNEDKALNFENPSEKLMAKIEKVLQGSYSVKTVEIENNHRANFNEIHRYLSNEMLKTFVTTPIIVDNRKSSINKDALAAVHKNLEVLSSDNIRVNGEDKLRTIESNIKQLESRHILYGELSDRAVTLTGYKNEYESQLIEEYESNSNIKRLSNLLVYGTPVVTYSRMDLRDFLGINGVTDPKAVLEKMRFYLAQYERDANLVIGTGGYLDILSNVLKRYKDTATEDAKVIKDLSSKVKASLNGIMHNPEDQALIHRVRRFTNIVVNVQKIKTNFIAFRQNVIGNVLTAFSSENYALSTIFIPEKVKDLDEVSELVGEKFQDPYLSNDDRFETGPSIDDQFEGYNK